MSDHQLPLNPATHIRQSSRQVHCLLGDVFVLMDAASGEYFELNRIGSRLWKEIAAPISIEALVNRLSADYDVDPITCNSEVLVWIGKMRRLGFIEVEDVFGD